MSADLLLAGGGLANCLIAYRVRQLRPAMELTLVEARERLGAGHTWSFHDGDISPGQLEWIGPLIERSWGGHEVRFPGLRRRLEGSYHTLTSERVDRVLAEGLGGSIRRGATVAAVGPGEVRLADGTILEAGAVIDGRGAEATAALRVGFQKFLGLHVELEAPANLGEPILMDATVAQRDGFRFFYTLPFSERSLLIEDTRYSDGPAIDRGEMRRGIERYARRQGWRIRRVIDEEEGSLPIVLDGDIGEFWRQAVPGLPRSGMRAALFHPTTGYSLPEAVRLADEIAALETLDSADLDRRIRRRSMALWRRGGFFRLLNRMLFRAAEPERRYRVLERFYRLPEPLIRRFYAGRPGLVDRARILTGRPPVPLGRALACMLPGSMPKPKPAGARNR